MLDRVPWRRYPLPSVPSTSVGDRPVRMTPTEIPSFSIADLRVAPALVLAPMSGVTDSPFRCMVKAASGDAVGLMVTEFIAIERLTKRELRSMVRMSFKPLEAPVGVQIFGADPTLMAEAAKMAEDAGAALVEINCGCPAPKVVRRGGGAALLKDLGILERILRITVPAVGIPVTIKIRNGWDAESINALETLRVAMDTGVAAIGVHGRTRRQLYRGEADWDIIREMKAVSSIPVLGSGDVVDPAGAIRRFAETGCDGVLIGRGAIKNPWIFRQIRDVMAGREPFEPTWRHKIEALTLYRDLLLETYPPKVAPGRMKMMLSRLLKRIPHAHEARSTCMPMQDPQQMLDFLWAHCERYRCLDEGEPSLPESQAA